MAVYTDSEEFYKVFKLLFQRMQQQGPQATEKVAKARLSIRFKVSNPEVEILIDGRRKPVEVHYGSNTTRPDLNVELTADAFHDILLGELRLRKALGSGKMKVQGPVLKTFVLEDVLHSAQALYPQVLSDLGREARPAGV